MPGEPTDDPIRMLQRMQVLLRQSRRLNADARKAIERLMALAVRIDAAALRAARKTDAP